MIPTLLQVHDFQPGLDKREPLGKGTVGNTRAGHKCVEFHDILYKTFRDILIDEWLLFHQNGNLQSIIDNQAERCAKVNCLETSFVKMSYFAIESRIENRLGCRISLCIKW